MSVGKSVTRKEAYDKVTGRARYTADILRPGSLHARLLTSTQAHAMIKSLNVDKARQAKGVKAIVTGLDVPIWGGVLIKDRQPIATDRVRCYGEVIAIVVAQTEQEAAAALELIEVEYEALPIVGSVADALAPDATVIHSQLGNYETPVQDVYPEPGTNIASSYKVRKGDMQAGWQAAAYTAHKRFSLPASVHASMETHAAQAEILPDGRVHIVSSSQSPYQIKQQLSDMFNLDEGKVWVDVPLVGGGFGGKSAVQIEILAYVASRAAGGRNVRLVYTRADEFTTAPSRLALEADIKLGVTAEGMLCVGEMTYWLDTGAYSEIGPYMSKAIAVDCTGPYNIENLSVDSICVYTNHNYVTAFRGFSHESLTLCVERTMDALAGLLCMCPVEFRRKNAIRPGNLSPTQVELSLSNVGNLEACIDKLSQLVGSGEGDLIDIGDGKVRAKGYACLWKTPNPPVNASAGAVITFNSDGSVNLVTGAVEMGSGGQTAIAQMLADKLRMGYDRVHVTLEVDTRTMPEYYKTVASMSTYLVGRAVMAAAEDVIRQLKETAAIALRCPEDDLDFGEERVFCKAQPKFAIGFQDLAFGLKHPGGNTVGRQIVGRGGAVFNHLTPLAPDNGKGKTGPAWTVGAQMVEVEFDRRECSYRLIRAATVMDVGRVIDPMAYEGMVRGGMSMGLSLAREETLHYGPACENLSTSFRAYKVMRIGEEPQYLVQFVETPQLDAPFGNRAYSEHGIIGMPAALCNALSRAIGRDVDMLPATNESLWRLLQSGNQAGEVMA